MCVELRVLSRLAPPALTNGHSCQTQQIAAVSGNGASMPAAITEALAASCGNKAHVWQPFSREPDLGHFAVASEGKLYCVQWNQVRAAAPTVPDVCRGAVRWSRWPSTIGSRVPGADAACDGRRTTR